MKFLAFPFALANEAVDLSKLSDGVWQGSIQTQEVGLYIDSYLLFIMGGIPWQVIGLFNIPALINILGYKRTILGVT